MFMTPPYILISFRAAWVFHDFYQWCYSEKMFIHTWSCWPPMKNKIKTRVLSYLSVNSFCWVVEYLALESKIDCCLLSNQMLQNKVIKVGVLKEWIMISICQEMAFVAAISQVKNCYKILKHIFLPIYTNWWLKEQALIWFS